MRCLRCYDTEACFVRCSTLLAFPTSPAAMSGKVDQGYIPDIEGLAGRARSEAMYKKAFNEDYFDRDATAFMEVRSLVLLFKARSHLLRFAPPGYRKKCMPRVCTQCSSASYGSQLLRYQLIPL